MNATQLQTALILAVTVVFTPGLVQAAPRNEPCFKDRLVGVVERRDIAPATEMPGVASVGQQAEEPIVFGLPR